ncbi:arginine--tRNA ligase [Candidatus Parcubacteria bacterium]|nr:arginine--tRNA ligase [Candidatus Parcubacteria bacterium]
MQEILRKAIAEASGSRGDFLVAPLEDLSRGDYYTNAALVLAKVEGKDPRVLAEELRTKLEGLGIEGVESIEAAGPGFLNFRLKRSFFSGEIKKIAKAGKEFGKGEAYTGKKVIVEYTDPNPFKEIHIGHLMSNTIGESVARLHEWSGADLKRACYQGDVGLQIAKAIKGMMLLERPENASLQEQVAYLGRAYAAGSAAYEEGAAEEIKALNKKIYERSDEDVNQLYDWGRKASLDHFETIYKKLGTKFNLYFFESETGVFGRELVREFVGRGVFEESDGAVIYRGEKHGLHTRVFINSEGLPTYEAKELGLAKTKHDRFPYDLSVVLTGNEVNEYFKVLLSAMREVYPELAEKTKHIGHGMLRLTTGKMSSRTGNVISAESLIAEVTESVLARMTEFDGSPEEKEKTAEMVAIAAIKHTILRQAPGKDIIFDPAQALSLEGDSGPYLQYALVRTKTLLAKAAEVGETPTLENIPSEAADVERLLHRFPQILARSAADLAPQHVVTYITEVASAFNAFYAGTRVIGNPHVGYYLALTQAVGVVLENGLSVLGIPTPERM